MATQKKKGTLSTEGTTFEAEIHEVSGSMTQATAALAPAPMAPPADMFAALDELAKQVLGARYDQPWVSTGDPDIDRITGWSIGWKRVGPDAAPEATPQLALVFHVYEKLPEVFLRGPSRILKQFRGYPVDVVEDRGGRAQAAIGSQLRGGLMMTSGTLGCFVVVKQADGNFYLHALSCTHVIGSQFNAADVYDAMGQLVGRTSNESPIMFNGWNTVDAAIVPVRSDFVELKTVDGLLIDPNRAGSIKANELRIGQQVTKYGAKTSRTRGQIENVGAQCYVDYTLPSGQRRGYFEQVIFVGPGGFSDRGDSGALVVDAATNRHIGILIGGNATTSFVVPIAAVYDKLNIDGVWVA